MAGRKAPNPMPPEGVRKPEPPPCPPPIIWPWWKPMSGEQEERGREFDQATGG